MKTAVLFTVSVFFAFGSLLAQHTWQMQETNVAGDLQAVSFINENTGIAVGNAGIVITTENGGTTWATRETGIFNDLNGVDFAADTKIFAVGSGGKVLMTEDLGQSWETVVIPNVEYDLLDVAFDKGSGRGVITGQTNAVIVTSDFGETWTVVQDGYMSTFYAASMPNQNVSVVMGWNSIFQPLLGYTLDWQTWDYQSFYPTWGGVFYEGRASGCKFLSENEGYVVGIYFVPGGGFLAPFGGWANNAWDAQSFPQPLTDIDVTGPFGVVVGSNGYLAESSDNCQGWEMISTGAVNAQLNDVHLVGNTGYIAGETGTILKMISTVSVPENSGNGGFSCYPNPARYFLNLQIKNPANALNIEILDVSGTVMAKHPTTGNVNEVTIPVNDLPSGFYFLRIGGNGIIQTLKFSKD